MGHKLATWACSVVLAAFSGLATAAYQWNVQTPASKSAQDVYDKHLLMMGIIVVIVVGVFAVMFYSVFAHRKSKGHEAVQFHENATVEIIWTIVPLVILILMAWPATNALLSLRETPNPELTIKVTSYQGTWGYDYLKGEGEGISFVAALATPHGQFQGEAPKGENYLLEAVDPVVVPVGKTIRILTTGNDVIHSWWVPALGVKQDTHPGFMRDTWFKADKEGTFRGQCAEPCGKDHGFMPIVVKVVSAEKYSAWASERKKKMAAQADGTPAYRYRSKLE